MIKSHQNYTLLLLLSCCSFITAQSPCSNGRYATDAYTTYSVTSNVEYGSNQDLNGIAQTLTLDFYEPSADTSQARPLIIWAHGGVFAFGSKTDNSVMTLSQRFAKKGFVCASINYRLGFDPPDSSGVVLALLRAVQDMKASVRFFYKDKLTANRYKIDTNHIFIGGISSGAITALHVAYLNKTCEINPYIPQRVLDSLGGLEGGSGNQCYSSKVKGVINLCGALGKYGWMEAGDVPICSMHGTDDNTVIYGRGKSNPGIPMLYLDGSRMIDAGVSTLGINHRFYTWYGAGHIPFSGTLPSQLAYMDSTVNFVRDYLISRVGCANPPLLSPNVPSGTVTAYGYTVCTANVPMACHVGVPELKKSLLSAIYPNPSDGQVQITFEETHDTHTVALTDVTGRIIRSEATVDQTFLIEKLSLHSGIYFLRVTNSKGFYSTHKLIFQE